MTSSWEQAGREAACTGEAVTFTCTAQETYSIEWKFRGQRTAWVPEDIDDEFAIDKVRSDYTGVLTSVEPNGINFNMIADLLTVAILPYNGSNIECTATTSASLVFLMAGI